MPADERGEPEGPRLNSVDLVVGAVCFFSIGIICARIYSMIRFEVELQGFDAREASLPIGSPRVAAMRDRWPVLRAMLLTLQSAEQNAVARELIERLIIEGPSVRIVWRPEFAAAFGPEAGH